MRLILSTLFVLAMPMSALFQATTPIPAPQTACGKEGLKCYNKWSGEIKTSLTKVDMKSACSAYSSMSSCLDTALKGCNGVDKSEVSAYQKAADSDAAGICDSTGGVTNCGNDMAQCMNDVTAFKNAFSAAKATKACSVLTKLETCTKGVLGTGECPDKYDQILSKAQASFAEDDLIAGCEGPCGKKAGECTKAFTADATKTLSEINLPTFCKDSYDAMTCIRGLSQETECKDDASNVGLADQMVDSMQKFMGDLCDADGKPSACSKEISVCIENVNDLTSKMDITKQCQATAAFLECISSLKCQSVVKNFVDKQKLVLETEERKQNCPTVGSCTDRMKVCEDRETALGRIAPGESKSKACRLSKKGISCFDVIRKDPYCSNENMAVSDFEQRLKDVLSSQCGDGASFIQLSLALIFLSVLASLKSLL